ncbi:hypothetical protein [Rathayibacter sp. AY1B5]|uniref:hypothetical protein n=1 Tax=Rathayibacter sp. AY1B5 TaxID=2080530 RepID=UPI000CE8A3A6|nr:hypothetical protein [Rathayibacter sp. AY1B5]PPI21276.1 hypothetical protein C5D44_15405 [Rathayibacter sp. AY1B5]
MKPGDVYEEVLDSIEARLRRRLAETESPVYQSLAERIEKLRNKAIENVEDSLAFLEEVLKIAQDVVAADRAAEAGNEATLERPSNPKRGALTQIVEENIPPACTRSGRTSLTRSTRSSSRLPTQAGPRATPAASASVTSSAPR